MRPTFLVVVAMLFWRMPISSQAQELPQPKLTGATAATPLAPAVSADQVDGHFFCSDGYDRQLDLELRVGRFILNRGSCTADIRYEGAIEWDGDGFVLTSETETDLRKTVPARASEKRFGPFVPVPWGERLYLVERDLADEYCSVINQGSEPRFVDWGSETKFLLRDDDWNRDAKGDPVVPEAWRHGLLPGPVVGHIVSVAPDGRAKLDLGLADGLREGTDLTLHFMTDADWAVPQGRPWFNHWLVRVENAQEHESTLAAMVNGKRPSVGQLVTGRIPTGPPLPLKLWRKAGEDTRLRFDPVPPLPTCSQELLDRWTAEIRDSLSPGRPIDGVLPVSSVDQMTPAFFNALRGLDMRSHFDVDKAQAILDVWKGYRSQCSDERNIKLELDEMPRMGPRCIVEERITKVETFVKWWREMTADPERFANYQRAQQP